MDHKQLRIGNIINVWHEPSARWKEIKVSDGSVIDFIGNQDDEESRGVPLTEAWLGKFGFREHYNVYDTDKMTLIRNPYSTEYMLELKKDLTIAYVHQLQNLYFTLTGEEL